MCKPIRVAQIMGKMVNGGVEAVVMNYYRHIDRTKVQFDFIVDEDSTVIPKNEIESLGGRVYIVPPYQHIRAYIKALEKLFMENDYKIVHSHLNTLSVFPLYAAKKVGMPVRIAHNHSTAGKGETKKNIMKYMLRPFAKVNATHYAACSRYAGEWLFGKKSMKNGEVTVFNNAIDLDKFKYNETVRNEVRKELGIEDKFVVGHVGRFCYQKNQEFVVRVFNEIHKRIENSTLLLIGDGGDLNMIKALVDSLKLNDCVQFLGSCNDVYRKYQAMDVFLFPSRYEGLGMVAVEAQTASVHIVASTELPDDVKMTSYIDMLPLNVGEEAWAEKALEYVSYEKTDITPLIKEYDYDINIECKKLVSYYNSVQEEVVNDYAKTNKI